MAVAMGDLRPKLELAIAAVVKESRLPGAAAGVVRGDDLIWSGGYGFADVGEHRPPDASTLYRIASITKTFTATAVLQLRDEGRLHLDDPAVTYLPELKATVSSFGPIETVTLRRLLSHESGLVSDPPGTDWTSRVYEGDPLVNLGRVEEIGTRVPPNLQQKYSNLGYQLLGEVVTRVSGMPYVGYIRANLLDPLRLASTAFEPLIDELTLRRAIGYRARWMSDDVREAEPIPMVFAEGGLWSCVEDLARWLGAQFREEGGDRGDAQILAGSTLKEMHRPRYLGDEKWTEAWCIGWYAIRKEEVVWIQHSGGLPGFSSNICFHPKEKVGAIALVNGTADVAELAMKLGSLALDAIGSETMPAEPPVPMPSEYGDLVGLYGDPDDGILIRCEWRDGTLVLIDADEPEWLPKLEPGDGPDRFVVSLGWRESGEPAIFRRTADGRVRSVVLGPQSLSRFDPVEG
jgi:D-alanyl-D-alanine carboxypeptidase